jgi:hypothetical protein
MALFPATPANGNTANVNGITYTYYSNQTAWVRTGTFLADFTAGNGTFSGNVTANYYLGNGSLLTGIITSVSNISNGNSNLNIPTANGNITLSVSGNANVLTVTGNALFRNSYNITGFVYQANTAPSNPQPGDQWYNTFNGILFEYINDSTTSQWVDISSLVLPNLASNATSVQTNLATSGSVFVPFISGTANGSYALISNTNYTANLANGFLGATLLGGTLTTAAQSNITSVGTLTLLGVSGTVTASAFTANTGVFTGNGSGLSAIAGANVTGTVASATAATTAGTVTTAAQPNITSVGTLTSLAVTGNTTSGNFVGRLANGNSNVNIAAANGNVTIAAVGNSVVTVTGTGVNVNGTLNATGAGQIGGDLLVSGNAVVTGNLAINGNLTYLNVETIAVEDPIIQLQTGANGAAPVANSGKDVGSALNYYNSEARIAFMGWDVSNAEFGMASVATIASEVVTFTTYGNLRVGNIIGNGQALTAIAGANVTGTVANATFATSAGTAGTVTTNAQPNITSVGTLTSLAVTGNANAGNIGVSGNITAANITANTGVFTGNGSGLSAIAGANVTGTVASATTAGTVTTAAQPNITSVGTLTSLTVSGNISGANVIATNNMVFSVATAISAAGTAQGNATAITKDFNVVSTVASGAGVRLPTAIAGYRITVINTSANALLVYPATSGIINSAAANASYSQPAGARLDYISTTTTQWYTLNATYG